MVTSTGSGDQSFEQFIEECRQEYEKAQRELKEIDLLIQQTTAEIERQTHRNAQAANRLRQVEASLDTVPREDIKEAYTAVMETQQRLFTMQGQLEKLQSNQRDISRYLDLLDRVLAMAAPPEREVPVAEEQAGGDMSQSLVVRIIEAQERERLRLSRQMHDGPAQSLTNLILQAEICERLFDTDPERARAELAALRNAVAGTFKKVKGFIINLRPMMLDDLGLVPTLRRYVDSFSENTGVLTQMSHTGKEKRIPRHEEVTIFRIVQELLNNAVEYGNASKIQIHLDIGETAVRVTVEDNGSGFDVSEMLSSEKDEMGLATMRERIEMLNGQIHFDSGLGRGTVVTIELPI